MVNPVPRTSSKPYHNNQYRFHYKFQTKNLRIIVMHFYSTTCTLFVISFKERLSKCLLSMRMFSLQLNKLKTKASFTCLELTIHRKKMSINYTFLLWWNLVCIRFSTVWTVRGNVDFRKSWKCLRIIWELQWDW